MDLQDVADKAERYWGYLVAGCAGLAVVYRYGARVVYSVGGALRLSNSLHRHYGGRDVADKLIQDMRDRHRQVATNRTRLELVESRIRVAVYITDAAGKCTDANRELCQLFGLDHDDFPGLGWTEALCREDRLRVVEAWERCVIKQIAYGDTYCVNNPRSGERITVETRAEPVVCCDGTLLGFVGVVWRIDGAES